MGRSPGTFLGSCEGVVSKQGQRPLLRSRPLWRVLRRRGGVDQAALQRRVQQAMNSDPPRYHPTRSNCLHFALRLLDPDLEHVHLHHPDLGTVSPVRSPPAPHPCLPYHTRSQDPGPFPGTTCL